MAGRAPWRASGPHHGRQAVAKLGALLLALLLGGCALVVDTESARVCRRVVAGLNLEATRIEILHTLAVPAVREGTGLVLPAGVEIIYATPPPPNETRWRRQYHRMLCRFEGHASAGSLMSVDTERGPLGAVRLYLLQRFWLDTPEGRAADPEPVANAARALPLPPRAAITLQALLAALPQLSLTVLLAGAYALLHGLLGRANLAFGDLAMLGSYAALMVAATAVGGLAPGTMLLAAGLGVWAAATAARGLSRFAFLPATLRSGQSALIVSVALAVVLSETVRLAQGAAPLAAPPVLNQPHAVARAGSFLVTTTPMALAVSWIALMATLLLLAYMNWSRFGRRWRAAADDRPATALLGIDPLGLQHRAFLIAGALAGLAGALAGLHYGSATHGTGLAWGLKAIIAAIIGGAGSLPGAVMGGFLVGGFEALWSAFLPVEHRDIALFAALVAALVLRPGGLLGRPDLETRHDPGLRA